MTKKRFELNEDSEWWTVKDNTIKVNEFGYREDLTGEDIYRGLHNELTEEETVKLLNGLYEDNLKLEKENKELKEKNKLIFEQIRAFGKSHHADMDFEGSRVANQLLYYLKDLENGD